MAYSRYTGFREITDRDVLELHCIVYHVYCGINTVHHHRSCGYLCTYFDTCYRLSIQRNRIHFYWSGNQYYSDCLQKRCLKIFFPWGFSIPWVLPLTAWAREKRQNYMRFFLTAWDLACMYINNLLWLPLLFKRPSYFHLPWNIKALLFMRKIFQNVIFWKCYPAY